MSLDTLNMPTSTNAIHSGSHIMSFVLAQQQSWGADSLSAVPLGPFGPLRDGVSGLDASKPNDSADPKAEFFMWEEFTTKPYFHPTAENPNPPLKKIGEIFTPWPSWMIVASTKLFPNPESDQRLNTLFQAFDQGIKEFEADTAQAVKLLGTGELGCTYIEEDAREWLKDVKFTNSTLGVDGKIIAGVVDVLQTAGVIDSAMSNDEAVQRVIGIKR